MLTSCRPSLHAATTRHCRHRHWAAATASCRHAANATKLPPQLQPQKADISYLLPPTTSHCCPASIDAAVAVAVTLSLQASCCCRRHHRAKLARQRFCCCRCRRQATTTATTLLLLPPRCCHRRQAVATATAASAIATRCRHPPLPPHCHCQSFTATTKALLPPCCCRRSSSQAAAGCNATKLPLLPPPSCTAFFSCCNGKSCGMHFFGGMMTPKQKGSCKLLRQ